MRQFENKDFPYHLAEGLESMHITTPDDESSAALAYITQFVYRTSGQAELLAGYIPENYVDALVRVRDANSNRDFNSAVEAIGVDGGTSQEVTAYTEGTWIETPASFEAVEDLSQIARNNSTDLSDEGRKQLYSIREVIENVSHQETVQYYIPTELFTEIAPLLDQHNILL